jgi:xanthine dehydrogenase accessory factor
VSDAELLGQAADWLEAGRRVALATVLSTWGSAPRPAGSLLAVDEGGAFTGSVSGGCVEGAVVEVARELLRGGAPRLLQFGVTDEKAWSVGLACGGRIEVRVEPACGPLLRPLLADLAARRPVVLATPLAAGAAFLIHPLDGAPVGEPGAEPGAGALRLAAREAAARDRSGRWDGPAGPVFLRVFNPPVRLVLVGAVHIAQALAPMARLAGCDVVVVDPRRGFATAERLPGVTLLDGWPDVALARLAPDRRTAVVALTHDPKLDDPALAAALGSEAFYVGALGSRKSHAARCQRLAEAGFGPAAVARVRGPVGLDIGAESPGEIAVAILAELVAHLRRP